MNKALLPIFLVIVVDILGMTIMFPLLPFYTERFGGSPASAGLLISVYALCQLFGGPVLGRLSDTAGRKPLLLLSQVGTLIGFAILAWASSLWMLFLSRIIDGFTAGNISLAQAYISDVTRPEERTRSFAVIGIAFGIGFLIGPAIAGFLAQFSYQLPIFIAMGLSATSILATLLLLPLTKATGESTARFTIFDWRLYLDYFRRPQLGPLLWQFLAFIFAFSVFMSGFALFAERRFTWAGHAFGPREVGYVYAYFGVLGIILQGGLIGHAVRRFGDRGLIRYGFTFGTLGFILLGWTFSLPVLLAVAVVISFSVGVLRPAITSLVTQNARPGEQGGVLGLTQSLQALAGIVGPALAGFLIDHRLLVAWTWLAAGSLALGLFAHARNMSAPQETPEHAGASR